MTQGPPLLWQIHSMPTTGCYLDYPTFSDSGGDDRSLVCAFSGPFRDGIGEEMLADEVRSFSDQLRLASSFLTDKLPQIRTQLPSCNLRRTLLVQAKVMPPSTTTSHANENFGSFPYLHAPRHFQIYQPLPDTKGVALCYIGSSQLDVGFHKILKQNSTSNNHALNTYILPPQGMKDFIQW